MGFETAVAAGVLRLRRPDTRWLSTGWAGGFADAPAGYNVSVPEGWDRTDLDAYVARRLADAGFRDDFSEDDGDGVSGEDGVARAERPPSSPALLTGVDMRHARVARSGSVLAVATAGVSNPAALPVGGGGPAAEGEPVAADDESTAGDAPDRPGRGTVNILVGTDRRLDDGALANLVAVAAEAKAATLLSATGVPGTTTDAVVVGSARDGEPATFSGSATPVGSAARACVRDAVRASLDSRYAAGDASVPASVADAEHGVVTDRETEVRRA
ncbi:adenosylcobinamide amidohydrolase [Halobaculum gomorrense]|uniref:Adenosylcobinamide hydrolase n=1 Tax=Halobaculum gomorrense TaxID=43928 RepID=A0A1M5JE01_9EURY|nr:adenosylcobinamide amidohydrolase [Halobaculum gomorrense]SHG38509.1 adenosylcobinamide hydrolase [Halobaculum gomorrense]